MSSVRRIIIRSLKILLGSTRRETVISLVILSIRSLLPLVVLLLIRHYVDLIVDSGVSSQTGNFWATAGLISTIALTLLADDLLSSLGKYVSRKQAYRLDHHISDLIHRHASNIDLISFDNTAFYDLLSRAERDMTWRPAAIVSDIFMFARGILSFIATGYVLRTFGIVPFAILAAMFLPLLWIQTGNSERLYKVKKEVTPHVRQASYFSWLLTGEKPAREVRLFGLQELFIGLFRRHLRASKEPEIVVAGKNARNEILSSVIKILAFVGVLISVTMSYVDSKISAGDMVMYIIAFRQALLYLRDAVAGYSGIVENERFMSDLFRFLDTEGNMHGDAEPPSTDNLSEIAAEGVTFTYPGASRPALQDVTLRISRGEKVAIIGPNGSGKTTLVKLLCRLYDPDEGRITVNGTNAAALSPSSYRRLFSVVFQNFMLYYLSAGDNIRLGYHDDYGHASGVTAENDPGDTGEKRGTGGTISPGEVSSNGVPYDSGDNEKVKKAAEAAGILELLEALPEGFDTQLGHHTEGGRELSWGEWQKIAIARAIYRKSPVLILDEPASSLDADSEYEIFSDLSRITGGRTCIFISHRLSNVRDADRIIVLDRGRIAETGTHDELMAAKGRYYSMFTRQKSMYR